MRTKVWDVRHDIEDVSQEVKTRFEGEWVGDVTPGTLSTPPYSENVVEFRVEREELLEEDGDGVFDGERGELRVWDA